MIMKMCLLLAFTAKKQVIRPLSALFSKKRRKPERHKLSKPRKGRTKIRKRAQINKRKPRWCGRRKPLIRLTYGANPCLRTTCRCSGLISGIMKKRIAMRDRYSNRL